MSINEVFPNPTVKKVIFQIRFPNLFYIENKIGELQAEIMKEFPESALLIKRQFVIADLGPKGKLEDISGDLDKETGKKIWQFKSKKDFQLNVLSDSLDITSQYHKTYNLKGGHKFRDIIIFVLEQFFKVAPIPIINRIGLRYIDECPIPAKNNRKFKSYYNTTFPLKRFNLSEANEMDFKVIIKKDACFLRYIESLSKAGKKHVLILDYDGFAENISPKDYLATTDKLHKIISTEYEKTIKEPVYKYMRKKRRR